MDLLLSKLQPYISNRSFDVERVFEGQILVKFWPDRDEKKRYQVTCTQEGTSFVLTEENGRLLASPEVTLSSEVMIPSEVTLASPLLVVNKLEKLCDTLYDVRLSQKQEELKGRALELLRELESNEKIGVVEMDTNTSLAGINFYISRSSGNADERVVSVFWDGSVFDCYHYARKTSEYFRNLQDLIRYVERLCGRRVSFA